MLLIDWIMQPYFSREAPAKGPSASRNPAPKLLQRQIASVAACCLEKFSGC